jgi:hypothetical protein
MVIVNELLQDLRQAFQVPEILGNALHGIEGAPGSGKMG